MAYVLKYRDEIGHVLDDAASPLNNDAAERALQIVGIGRKNLLFAGHIEGAQNLAVLSSIGGTCHVPSNLVCQDPKKPPKGIPVGG